WRGSHFVFFPLYCMCASLSSVRFFTGFYTRRFMTNDTQLWGMRKVLSPWGLPVHRQFGTTKSALARAIVNNYSHCVPFQAPAMAQCPEWEQRPIFLCKVGGQETYMGAVNL
ncbi:hypothetical protein H1C71_023060, partial [Ictidomys tridecemlineatus]